MTADTYRLYDWHLIDTFVYFSHNMVTIPPPVWTNCAHRNGTAVLGTVRALHLHWHDVLSVCSSSPSGTRALPSAASCLPAAMHGWHSLTSCATLLLASIVLGAIHGH